MKTLIKNKILFLLLNFSLNLYAAVDMQSASFNETWVDITLSGNNSLFLITRTYNSRSTYKGHLGTGWCTNLEDQILIKNENIILLRQCENFMKPKSFHLVEDKLGIKKYTNLKNENEFILSSSKTLTYYNGLFSILKFNNHGRLTQIIKKNVDTFSLFYEEGKLSQIKAFENSIAVIYNKSGLLHKLMNSNGLKSTYLYSGHNLTSTQDQNNFSNSYNYSELNNLIQISGQQNIRIKYDGPNDRVQSIKQQQCQKDFKFTRLNDLEFSSSVENSCTNKKSKQITFKFTHILKDKKKILSKVTKNTDGALLTLFNLDNHKNRMISGKKSKE